MSSILFEINQGIAKITLNRPEKYNAINQDLAITLQKALNECAADKSVRVVYLTGSGKAFCAGQDLSEMLGENPPGFETILAEHYNPIIKKIRHLPKPVVCAVNGVAAGAGANIALACDIVVATASASFIQAFSKIGLIPDCGGTFTLPRLVGFQRASALMMLGDKVNAVDAERMGMLYKVFSDESFAEESMKIAITLSTMATRGLAYTKEALNASMESLLYDQLQKEDEIQYKAGHTFDYKEGITAFVEKRQPVFRGE